MVIGGEIVLTDNNESSKQRKQMSNIKKCVFQMLTWNISKCEIFNLTISSVMRYIVELCFEIEKHKDTLCGDAISNK